VYETFSFTWVYRIVLEEVLRKRTPEVEVVFLKKKRQLYLVISCAPKKNQRRFL
jgi:hypothetical protein